MLYTCTVEAIQWTGKNTKEVVKFCVNADNNLCLTHSENSDRLTILPIDTMHGVLSIPKNGYAVKMKKGNGYFIKVYSFDVFTDNFTHRGIK